MSRILARATGDWAGQPTLRPRLPLLFEPGLDVRAPGNDGEPTAERAAISAWGGLPGTADAEPDSAGAVHVMPADQGAADPGVLGPGWPDGDGPGPERQATAGRAARSAMAPRDQARPAGSPRLRDMAATGAAIGTGAGVPATGPARAAVTWPDAARPASAASFQPVGRRPAGQGPWPSEDQATAGPGGRRRSYPVRPVPHEDGPGPGPAPAASDLAHAPGSADMPAASAWPVGPAAAAMSAATPGPSAAPVVRIEIGRVEIRAEPAPPRPAAASQPGRPASRRRPAPDLAEYLKRRDGRP